MSDVVEELQALEACYPEPGAVTYTAREEEALRFARNSGDRVELGGTLRLPGVRLLDQEVSLRITLPSEYPARHPSLVVHCGANRDATESLQRAVDGTVAANEGVPCLLLCSTALADQAVALSHELDEPKSVEAVDRVQCNKEPAIVWRRLFWFHHIKSPTKRRVIVSAARSLCIGGFSKPGYPGVIVAEGTLSALQEYTATLRALRWSAMAIRGEESAGTCRALPLPLQELSGDAMSDLAARCRACGVEPLFLSALKLG